MQIGSSPASNIGQWVKMPENRLRVLVACGAGGAIAATFNAPITTVFFGVEILLGEFSSDALFTVMLSAMIADATAIPLLGSKPFLSGFPSGITLHHVRNYLLVAALAVIAALFGLRLTYHPGRQVVRGAINLEAPGHWWRTMPSAVSRYSPADTKDVGDDIWILARGVTLLVRAGTGCTGSFPACSRP